MITKEDRIRILGNNIEALKESDERKIIPINEDVYEQFLNFLKEEQRNKDYKLLKDNKSKLIVQ